MIELIDVSKSYDKDTHALHNVSFNIEAGEFIFLIGESGAGKSTMIKLLTREERPTYGTVILDNFDVSRMKKKFVPFLRRKIGLVFQDFRLIESKTVFENVAFAMEIVGAPQDLIVRRVPIVLSVVGLRHKAASYPNELSGGEAQRVAIARAMVNNPRLILADEPTGNLDWKNSEAIMALLDDINKAGTTVIACTHDIELVNRMNKRVIELKDGRVIRDDPPQICDDMTENFVAARPNISKDMKELLDDDQYRVESEDLLVQNAAEFYVPDIDELRNQVSQDSKKRRSIRINPIGAERDTGRVEKPRKLDQTIKKTDERENR